MRPHALPRVHVPPLHLADMVGAGSDVEGGRRAGEATARNVRGLLSDGGPAEVLVGRDVNHAGLRAEGNRRPVLAAPERRAVVRQLAGSGLVSRINVGTTGL